MAESTLATELVLHVGLSTDGTTLEARLVRRDAAALNRAPRGQNGVTAHGASGQSGVGQVVWTGKRGRLSRVRLGVRARTMQPVKRLTKAEIRQGQRINTWDWLAQVERPETRRDCLTQEQANERELYWAALEGREPVFDNRGDGCNSVRPCPFVRCSHHPYLDVNPETGSIKLNFPDLEVQEIPVTCAFDVADEGGETLEGVGQKYNLTRERIRQVEVRGLLKLKAAGVDTAKLSQAAELRDKIRGGSEGDSSEGGDDD